LWRLAAGTALFFEDFDARVGPLVGCARSSIVLGDMRCAIKWSFHVNTHGPQLILDGDHTYWSMC
jgi:hypothetical protein